MKQRVHPFPSRMRWLGAALVLTTLVFSGCGLTREAKEARFLDAGKRALAQWDYGRAIILLQDAARAKPGDAEPHYQLALVYIDMGDYPSGRDALKRAIELNPRHAQAKAKLASLLASFGSEQGRQDAKVLARDLLAANPNNVDALNALAAAEWNLGDARNAQMDLLRALSQAPQSLQASLNLARIKIFQKDLAGAEEVIKKAAAASPKAPEPVVALGELYMTLGKPEAAEQQYRLAVQLDPKNDLALLSLANLCLRTKRVDEAERFYKQVSALPGRKYKAVYAMFLFQAGKRDRAIAEFEKVAKEDPSDRSARTRLIEAYLAAGRLPDAKKLLNAALERNARDVDALLQRSRILLAAGNTAAAQKDIEMVLHFQSDSVPAHYILGKVHEAKGAKLSERQEFSEVLRLNANLLPVRIELSKLLLSDNAAKAALAVMDDTPDSQKKSIPAIEQRNWALLGVGEAAEARKGVDQGLAESRTPDLLLQDGILKIAVKRYGDAQESLREALRQSPDDVRALRYLVRCYAVQKQVPAAVNEVRQYAAQRPKSAPVQYFLGNLLFQTGDRVHAKEAFVAAKNANPNYAAADLSLAQLDLTQEKWDDARKQLNAILSARPENPRAWLWLGMLEESNGNHTAALVAFKKTLELEPDNAKALNNVAYILAEDADKPDEALKYAERAVELLPESDVAEDTLGWVLYRKGLFDLAVKHLERAVSRGSDVRVQYHLAMAYLKQGDVKRGRTTLQAALGKNPSPPEAKTAQQLFQASAAAAK